MESISSCPSVQRRGTKVKDKAGWRAVTGDKESNEMSIIWAKRPETLRVAQSFVYPSNQV